MTHVSPVFAGKTALATEVVGQGRSIVFLHANICDRRMWREQLDAVAGLYQGVAYDRRGFGETPADAEDHSPVADLLAVIEATSGALPVVLVGCSQGARIALDAALMHPSRVAALVLISPTVSGAPEASYPPALRDLIEQQRQAEQSTDLDRLNDIKARLFLDGPLAPEGRVQGRVRHLFTQMNSIALRSSPGGRNLESVNAFARLQEIKVPTQVVWGTLDFPHIQDRARIVASRLLYGEGHACARAAHLVNLDQPTALSKLILALARRCL